MNTSVTGVWHNQHHSILHLTSDGDRLTGTFRPGIGLLHGQSFPIQGWVLGDRVAFSVAFGPTGAITSWTGHLRGLDSTGFLDTLWNMSVREESAAGADEGWRSIWTGADTFRRGEPGLMVIDRRRPSVPAHGS
ncbi:MAG: avidin/streptavidin family protein [Polyangiaceae bacterium]